MLTSIVIHSASQIFLDDAMDLQIRIPPDRRRKVTVIRCSQTKMSSVFRCIFCLLHRSKRQSADQCLLVRPLYFCKQLLNLFWTNCIVCNVHRVPKIINKNRQLLNLFFIRLFMCPVNKRNLLPKIMFCHRLIGKQHKVFNNLCRHVPVIWFQLNRFSLLIQNHLRLRKIKINRASFFSLFA